MDPQVLLELIAKWEAKSQHPEIEDGRPESQVDNAYQRGIRNGKREAAEELNLLIKLLAR